MSLTNPELNRLLNYYNGKLASFQKGELTYLGYHLGNIPPNQVDGSGANEPVGNSYIRLETLREFVQDVMVAGDPSTCANTEQLILPSRTVASEDVVTWILEFDSADLSDTTFVRAYKLATPVSLPAFDNLVLNPGSLVHQFGKEGETFTEGS